MKFSQKFKDFVKENNPAQEAEVNTLIDSYNLSQDEQTVKNLLREVIRLGFSQADTTRLYQEVSQNTL